MFSALKSAASSAADAAQSQAAKLGKPPCSVCEGKGEKNVPTSAAHCVVCSRNVCVKCVTNIDIPDRGIYRKTGTLYEVPEKLKETVEGTGGVMDMARAAMKDGTEFVCCYAAPGQKKTCKDKCVDSFVDTFKDQMQGKLRLTEFQAAASASPSKVDDMSYSMPVGIDDTFNQRAMFVAFKGLTTAVGFVSKDLAMLGTVAIYGVKAKVVADLLQKSFGLNNDMVSLIFSLEKPVVFALRNMSDTCDPAVREKVEKLTYSEVAKDMVPSVFYLSRKHILDLKTKNSDRFRLSDDIATMPNASHELLDFITPYFGPANWLYKIKLPGVHASEEWTRWYLQKVLSRDGWTVVGCSLGTEQVPLCESEIEEDPKKPGEFKVVDKTVSVPAFAVVTRGKEALIVVRGTQSMADWTININMVPEKVRYYAGKNGENLVEGFAHAGMYKGAKAIIELCGVGEIVDTLVEQGYDIKVVGHSLGAGISCCIAVQLKTKYAELKAEGKRQDVPFIPSIGFGHPPCLGANIAEATKADKLCTAIVNEHDVVCRLSEFNFTPLAEEVFLYREEATKQMTEDLAAIKKYAMSLGATERLNALKDEEATGEDSQAEDELREAEETSSPMRKRADSIEREKAMRAKIERLCIPGDIVLFGTQTDGKVKAGYCPHDAKTLKRIVLVDEMVDDHDMAEYSNSMREVLYDRRTSENKLQKKQAPEHMDARDGPGWRKCSVCEMDVTWPFVTKSSACRAAASVHCQACGKLCCVVCAPAGDKIPAEASDSGILLSDRKTPLPSFGKHTPQRVCYPCYFNSHEL